MPDLRDELERGAWQTKADRRTVGTEAMSDRARPREPQEPHGYIGGFSTSELLGYLRKLEAHGFGEVVISAQHGRFLVRESYAHKPREDQPQLTD